MARGKGLGVQNRLKIIKIGVGLRSCLGTIERRKEAGSVEGRTQEVGGFQEPGQLIGRHLVIPLQPAAVAGGSGPPPP